MRFPLNSPVPLFDQRLTLSPLTQTLRPVPEPAPVRSLGTAGGRVLPRAAEEGGETGGSWNDADKFCTAASALRGVLLFIGLFRIIFLVSLKGGEVALSLRQVYGDSVQGAFAGPWWTEGYAPKSRRGILTAREDNRHSDLRRPMRDWFEQTAPGKGEVERELEEEI